jgi:hypothetical protein
VKKRREGFFFVGIEEAAAGDVHEWQPRDSYLAASMMQASGAHSKLRSEIFGGACAGRETWRPNASTPLRQVPILRMADGDSLDP